MAGKIEVFYTGGGITLAEADLNEKQFAVVSTEAPECLTIYNYADGGETFLPEDMVASMTKDELPPELRDLYEEMLKELNKA